MPKTAAFTQRIYSIDILRGAVMIIMALDHVRDYFHETASIDSPTNLLTTTPFLFFTRWITHFCAPTFVFLAGISAYLTGQKKNKKELSVFLLKRGLWLIFIEV
ncbi:MAG TPA: heparan-alpha-glucosaminide N-acetyltransferase domain-containing protein, partial [Puia sp.]|nr:heparan-alpha-glucosaminide N-acetyltransferase domain-containing protein [Puia sp.]